MDEERELEVRRIFFGLFEVEARIRALFENHQFADVPVEGFRQNGHRDPVGVVVSGVDIPYRRAGGDVDVHIVAFEVESITERESFVYLIGDALYGVAAVG